MNFVVLEYYPYKFILLIDRPVTRLTLIGVFPVIYRCACGCFCAVFMICIVFNHFYYVYTNTSRLKCCMNCTFVWF